MFKSNLLRSSLHPYSEGQGGLPAARKPDSKCRAWLVCLRGIVGGRGLNQGCSNLEFITRSQSRLSHDQSSDACACLARAGLFPVRLRNMAFPWTPNVGFGHLSFGLDHLNLGYGSQVFGDSQKSCVPGIIRIRFSLICCNLEHCLALHRGITKKNKKIYDILENTNQEGGRQPVDTLFLCWCEPSNVFRFSSFHFQNHA